MIRHSLSILLYSILLFAGKVSVAQTTTEKINKFLHEKMVDDQIPGLQQVVIRDNKIVLSEAMGMANVSFSVPVTKNTLFSINSIAKVFTGTAIMQLVEKGKIDIQKRKTTKANARYACIAATMAIGLGITLFHFSNLSF